MGDLEEQYDAELRTTSGVLVHANQSPGPCPSCGSQMHVRKTVERAGQTIAHGGFRVKETIYMCASGCKVSNADPDNKSRRVVIHRQPEVSELLLPRSSVGYDIMTFVGLERFVHYRQRDEIIAKLLCDYGLSLSTGEVSDLCRRFLVYLRALHEARADRLRTVLQRDGGWPLHIDATGENGQGTLLCVYAGWRGWALGAWKIPTERADAILPKLRATVKRFGKPCAVMRDLGKAVTEATRDLVDEFDEPVPVLACHLHFLKDVGKDLLSDSHEEMRALFRRFRVLPKLREFARDLGRTLGTGIDKARRDVGHWLAGHDESFHLPTGKTGLAVVRSLGQWILDYSHDGTDAGFPFDRPMMDLYRRCLRSLRAIESLLRKPCDDKDVYRVLERLHRIVEPVRCDVPFAAAARTLERRALLHDELRNALRLEPKVPKTTTPCSPQQHKVTLQDVEKAVKDLQASLDSRCPERGPAQNQREAIQIVKDHLTRHGSSLWGHVIALPRKVGGGIRIVERTNVILESFWHEMKHGERRRSGRKVLTQDFEQLPAEAVLARNLTHPDYVAVVAGTLDDLPRAFAMLDTNDRSRSLPARLRDAANRSTGSPDIVSSSLPKADRNLVRTSAMQDRIEAEVRSRAPRRKVM